MEAQYVLMKKVYADSGLDPERNITYVEGHMTGTPVGILLWLSSTRIGSKLNHCFFNRSAIRSKRMPL